MNKVRGIIEDDEIDIVKEYTAIFDRHPEYTEKQKECIRYGLYAGKACEVTDKRVAEKKAFNDFVENHSAFAGFSENAVAPLIREQDPEIQQKVISQIETARPQERERFFGSERKMKSAVARYHDVEPEKSKPKIKKLWGAVERADYTQDFVRTMIKNGVEPKVIRELVVKAIEVVNQE